jgi:hypothetical protein
MYIANIGRRDQSSGVSRGTKCLNNFDRCHDASVKLFGSSAGTQYSVGIEPSPSAMEIVPGRRHRRRTGSRSLLRSLSHQVPRVYTVTPRDATSSRGVCLVLVINASEFVSVGVAYVRDVEGRFVIWPRTRSAFIPPARARRCGKHELGLHSRRGTQTSYRSLL